MAFSGYGDDGTGGRQRNVRVSCGSGVVGCGRARSGAAFHARAQRGTFAAGGAGGTHGGAAGARDIQREIVRLAAARNTLPDDARDSPSHAARTPGFFAPGAESVAAAPRLGAIAGTGAACPGMESRDGCDVRADTFDVFRFSARRAARAAGPNVPP